MTISKAYMDDWRAAHPEAGPKADARYYEKNREIHLERSRRRHLECKAFVINKYGGHCQGCGTDELAVLSIDHINDDGNLERNGRGGRIYWELKRNPLRDDLQVLCMNCQWRKRLYRTPHFMLVTLVNPPTAASVLE